MDLEERLDGLNGEVTEGDGLDFIRGDLRSELLRNERKARKILVASSSAGQLPAGREGVDLCGTFLPFLVPFGALSFLNFLCYSSLVSILGSTTAV